MNETVERVARALWDAAGSPDEESWDATMEQFRAIYRRQARAAIAAMREPTEEMADAGTKVMATQHQRRWSLPIWRAMIDEALLGN
jgi:hypothetical protein